MLLKNIGKLFLLILIFLSVCGFKLKYNGKLSPELKVIKEADITYVAKDDLVRYFKFHEFKNGFYINDLPVTFLKDNPYFIIDKSVYNLHYRTKIRAGKTYIPVKFMAEKFNKHSADPVFSCNKKMLSYTFTDTKPVKKDNYSKKYNIHGLSIENKKNGTRIEIPVTGKFKSGDITSSITGNQLYVTFYKGKLDLSKFSDTMPGSVIKEVVPIQHKQSAQITFFLKKKIIDKTISIRKDKIVVTLLTAKPSKEDINRLEDKLKSDQEKWEINTIIIDPGHGGKDPGAIGKRGTMEKDIVLSIAKYLKRMFKQSGKLKVYMTRDTDKFIPLKERTEFANKKNGKLFISIHCNANKKRNISGFETYFLKPARTERAMKVAALENAAIKYESGEKDYKNLTDEDYIVLTMMQATFAKESEKWAMQLQKYMDKQSTMKNRGVDQAGFYVLIGASMPAVLFETGFISNPYEEKLLRSKAYQQKVAKAIYQSVIGIKKEIER